MQAHCPYAQLPVTFRLTGDAELAGPAVATAEGGMCGAYVRTLGRAGTAALTVHTEQTEDVHVGFTIEIGEDARWN